MGPELLYGARWATIVLDRDGRLVHCGREVAGAIEALEAHLVGASSAGR